MSWLSQAWHAISNTKPSPKRPPGKDSWEEREKANATYTPTSGSTGPYVSGVPGLGTGVPGGQTTNPFEAGPSPGLGSLGNQGSNPFTNSGLGELLAFGRYQSPYSKPFDTASTYESGPGLKAPTWDTGMGGDDSLIRWQPRSGSEPATGTTPTSETKGTDWAKWLGLGLQGAGIAANAYGQYQQGKTVDEELKYRRDIEKEDRERRMRAGNAMKGLLAKYMASGG